MNITDIKTAARVVHDGGIVAYPTESCYGLGCDPRRHDAVKRLLKIKRRSWQQGLILIAGRIPQLAGYLDCNQALPLQRAVATWPGPYTWLMPVGPRASRWLTGEFNTIAVRVTAHRGAASLCGYSRSALVSTSANRHGRNPSTSARGVYREFGDDIDYILIGNVGTEPKPSQVRHAVTNQLIRE